MLNELLGGLDWSFWWYVAVGVAVIAVTTLAAWYFQFLRPVAGAIAVAVGSFLYGYRRGEKDQYKKDSRRPKQQEFDPFWWLRR